MAFFIILGQKYWAKDIIFLITEHEQLGIQAWLDAYHGVTSGSKGVLMAGDLSGRAGSIQAAINLELHSMKISSIDVKVYFLLQFNIVWCLAILFHRTEINYYYRLKD